MNIDTNKSVVILFQPRTGSHVLAHYLGEVLNKVNLGELTNPTLDITYYDKHVKLYNKPKNSYIPTEVTITAELNDRMAWYSKFLDSGSSVMRAPVVLYQSWYPGLSTLLKQEDRHQIIYLDRADVGYRLISTIVSQATTVWHNRNISSIVRTTDKITVSLPDVKLRLNMYLKSLDHIREYFGEVQTMYYEEFQDSASKLRNLINGIPKQIVSTPFNKFLGNHKDLITNLDEVEDFYEQFVNEHKEYFPQYFGKLPHIKIPASQGRQPRDLSLELTDIREESASENQPIYCE